MIRVHSAAGQAASVYTISARYGSAVCVEDPKGRVWFLESDAGDHPTWTRDGSSAMVIPDGVAALVVLSIASQLDGGSWDASSFKQ
jgi:hypothetical protein